ncbi:integrase core domain-containing protein [Mesorhizobium sp. C280B]|uniref:integrase core domain-containing protein n=1 Tax=Mesorhizobium sp. C280B TaxID=2956828 RepID=UPI00333635B3
MPDNGFIEELQRPPARRTAERHVFTSLAQTRASLALWRADYNSTRPHSQIGWQTPNEFAQTFNPRRAVVFGKWFVSA